MNQKEVNELRRRWKPDKCAASRIYGCFVNSQREIVSDLDESLGVMPAEEAEMYLGLLKKSLSGTLGKNLMDIIFSTQQVADSDEHRLLSALRSSRLKDSTARQAFYQKAIDSLDMGERNYLILLACDEYDVPRRRKDGENGDSDNVFVYILCCICPVKNAKPELGYFPGDNEFHCAAGQVVSAPELGFLFPAFDDRAANLYNVLFYTRKPEELHQGFIDAVFCTEPPLSAAEQKEAFQSTLCETLEDACRVDVLQAIHSQLAGQLAAHKDSKDPEPLSLTAGELGGILQDCGVAPERIAAFQEKYGERMGKGAALHPANLIDPARLEIRTEWASLSIHPEFANLVETRVIDGQNYLLIPAGDEVEINGLSARFSPVSPQPDTCEAALNENAAVLPQPDNSNADTAFNGSMAIPPELENNETEAVPDGDAAS